MNREPPSNDHAAPTADDIGHQASAWFALFHGGAPSPAQRKAWETWMAADARHAQAYAELENLWAASALLCQPAPVAPRVPARLSRRRFMGMGLAASAAAASAGAGLFWLKGMDAPFADLRTAVGERRIARLPDGSTVEMAGHTAMNLDFSTTRRTVELLHGQAFFTVRPSTAGDFTVITQAGRLRADEAEFCLSCNHDTAQVAVHRRRVQVLSASQQTDLEEGLSLRFSPRSTGEIQRAELEQLLAWRSGRLVFFNEPLQAVVEELQRWREGRIFIMDKQLAARRVSLILNLEQPEQMLDVMSRALAVRTAQYTDLVTLLYPAA
ncbi:FecR family protein [Pseudomonas putida]|uniref:FecR family protein n=1 Tax=Pseudomonas putida TaxID=303 RepID=UPI00383AD5BF